MKALKKILISLIITLFFFFLLTTFIATPDFLKPIIQEKVETLTGYPLRLEGKLSWHYVPHFGITIDSISLQLPNEKILTLQGMTLELKLLPLLHKEFEPTGLTINHAAYQFPHQGMIQLSHIQMTTHNATATAYNGTIHVEGSVDFKPTLQFDLHTTITNVALAALLQDATGKPYTTGKLSADSHITGQSIATLDGDINTTISQGRLQLNNFNNVAQQALLLIGQPPEPLDLFDHITTHATIHHGIADLTSDLVANNYHAHGTGQTNLNDLSLDMMIHAYYRNNNTAMPIHVQGPLTNPKVEIPLNKVLSGDLSTLADHLGQLFHS